MQRKNGKRMVKSYQKQYEEYGYSPKSLGWIKGKQNIRFEALSTYVNSNSKLLDFGCGFGDLLKYLSNKSINVDYYGCDVVDEFINEARLQNPTGNYFKVRLNEDLKDNYDYILCSGTFNFLYSKEIINHQEQVFSTINNLYKCCNKMLSIDFQTEFVDFSGANSYHQDISDLIKFVAQNISRRFLINHSYLPFEYCIHIFKENEILKPENAYKF